MDSSSLPYDTRVKVTLIVRPLLTPAAKSCSCVNMVCSRAERVFILEHYLASKFDLLLQNNQHKQKQPTSTTNVKTRLIFCIVLFHFFVSNVTNIFTWNFEFSRRRIWSWLSCGMLHRVVWYLLTDVSEKLTAPITLRIEAVSCSETLVNIYQTTRCNIPETAIFNILLLSGCDNVKCVKTRSLKKVK
jgi:hypothetical protein